MARFHFVEDYERHVRALVAAHPIDEAMSLAVGGDYEAVGNIELDALRHAGLRDGMALLDFGCGSGRLAWAAGRAMRIDYLGLDVVPSLLEYAAARTPPHFRFELNRGLAVPAAEASFDVVACFSVFTHLLHAESFIYLEHMRRVLRPGGRLVFSFLEFAFPPHWDVFRQTVEEQRDSTTPHLNTFIERPVIDLWASRLSYARPRFIGGDEAPWGGRPLGQSIAVVERG